ncbi:RNA polymerase sigma-70 factor [Zhouia spongiae]|uniref:RNA polymerase sigma-70 factor n=1 Tax=Zhouia spongiae TaxID=2202721 RepID=A0ABY3YLC1_9FLAO|nr:RNA polymerase sigma-70 factor [Zhouia spongiae]UNY98441.1 RNA polymerase sigma-70 factor [Zhouia spongiae]
MLENQLLSDLKNGSKQAYRNIFLKYYKVILAYLIKLTGDLLLSEDLTQSVFLKLWTKRKSINVHTSLKQYLFSTAYNSFMDHYRSREREKNMHSDYLITSETFQEEHDHTGLKRLEDDLNRLRGLIDALPPKCKEIFLLSKQEGLKYKEIAEKLNVSLKTVESQMYIAMKKLREEFNS